jgi:hypothetical protein
MNLNDIPQFPQGNHKTSVSLDEIEAHVERLVQNFHLDLDPDFQRGHVWSEDQQVRFVEYILRGGEGGLEILFNQPVRDVPPMVILDGKQRLTAVLKFVRNELPVFGHLYREFDHRVGSRFGLVFRRFNIPTRKEVLEYYLSLNAGGTPHSEEEIVRVRGLLAAEE